MQGNDRMMTMQSERGNQTVLLLDVKRKIDVCLLKNMCRVFLSKVGQFCVVH